MPIISLPVINNDIKLKVNLLWLFVPKTGGSALINYFKSIGAQIYLGPEYNNIVGLIKCPAQHFDYKLLDSITNLKSFNYRFTIVRNPVDRIKSDYIWSTRLMTDDERPTFKIWLNKCMAQLKKDPYFLDNHLRPQVDFVGDEIDRVFKYEIGLEAIILSIFSELKISMPRDINIAKINTSSSYLGSDKRSGDVFIDQEDLNIIHNYYSRDFSQFSYIYI